MTSRDHSSGHAFISYVREDAAAADRIQRILDAAGVRVWRDTDDLWPGEDWRAKIREAITQNALAFVACFSENSVAKETSYQNEELVLAVDQLRQRSPGHPWLIPVRLSDCALPSFDLGAGRTLDSLQRIDLFGSDREANVARLVSGVVRILGTDHDPPSATASVAAVSPALHAKSVILDDSRQIELDDTVTSAANDAAEALMDDSRFPRTSARLTDDASGNQYLFEQALQYLSIVEPLSELLIIGCAWGRPHHDALWARAEERVANTARAGTGQTALVELSRLPLLPLLYAGSLAALHRGKLTAIKALTIDARYRHDSSGHPIPMIGAAHIGRPFAHVDLTADLLAIAARGDQQVTSEIIEALRHRRLARRHTPSSDFLHDSLRPRLKALIPDDDDYSDTFDNLEALLGLIAADAKLEANHHHIYLDGAWYGAYTWRRTRFADAGGTFEERLHAEFEAEGERWAPLRAGFFGGSVERAEAAFTTFLQGAASARQRQW